MAYLIKKNTFIFLLLCAAACVIGIVAPFVLPARFFYDALTIVNALVEEGLVGSYPFATLFYRITGLSLVPFFLVGLVQVPILLYILYKIGIPDDFHMLNVKNAVVYLGVLIVAVYTCMPSKEFITYVYVALIVFIFKSGRVSFAWSVVWSCLLLVFLGVFFRPYFMLMPIVALGMYAFTFIKMENKRTATIVYGILIIMFISFSQGLIKGEFLTESTREMVNADRLNAGDSNSIIISPVKPDTWYGEIVSVIYGFFSVNLPVNGFQHILSPQIIAFVVWQLIMFWILLVRFSWALKNRSKYKYELWALILVFSYFIVQGIFEPDLGSAVKHKMGLFPLIYYCLYYENSRRKVQQAV